MENPRHALKFFYTSFYTEKPMELTSRFETFYLVRKFTAPVLFAFLGSLFLYQGFKLHPFVHFACSIFFFVVSVTVLLINLASISSLKIEDTRIVIIPYMFGKQRYVDFSEVESSHLEFIRGIETDAGYVNPGYYRCVLMLKGHQKFILSPDKFENYSEILKAISYNRTKLSDDQRAT